MWAVPSLIFGCTGLWTLIQQENVTARVVNFWTWAIMYGLSMLAFTILLIAAQINANPYEGIPA